jgi:NAD(P)-dependent dehydrogenase (short-subunit alcohol dehydrogenase family)
VEAKNLFIQKFIKRFKISNGVQEMTGNEHKTIVINGVTGGIGAAIARKLAQQGYSLALVGRDSQKLSHLKTDLLGLTGKNSIEIFVVSALKKELVDYAASEILKKYTSVYAYINSAGYVKQGSIFEVSDENWSDLFKLSLMSNIWFVSGLAKNMIEKKEGRIIFINGVFSIEPSPDFIINSTLTGAIRNLAKALSKDLGQYKVTVNTINPGATDTALWEGIVTTLSSKLDITGEEFNKKSVSAIPLNRIATPLDVANCVAYLCSKEADYINGAGFTLDGGFTASC